MATFVFKLGDKVLWTQTPPPGMPHAYTVGQGIVIDSLPVVVALVNESGSTTEVTVEHQDAHPELFCAKCGGTLGVCTDRPVCHMKMRGTCHLPKPKHEAKTG